MRSRSSAVRFSHTKRQQMGSSSPMVSNDDSQNGGDEERDRDAPMRGKKEKVRGSKWRLNSNEADGEACGGGSEGEEGDALHLPLPRTTTNSPTSRKRIRLNGKASEDCDAVDPAAVPRKLRSAVNKRSSQSASPPVPHAKKKFHHAANEIEEPYVSGGRQSTQYALDDSITKDEEEVAETLYALAGMASITMSTKDKEGRRTSEDKSNPNTASTAFLEASKEETANASFSCMANEVKDSSCEPVKDTIGDETTVLEHSVTISGVQTIDPEPNGAAQPDVHVSGLVSKIGHVEHKTSRNLNPSVVGTSTQCSGNGVLQPTKYDALQAPEQKPDISLWPFMSNGSAAVEYKEQQVKQNTASEAVPCPQSGLSRSTHGHLTLSSSSKSAIWPGPASRSGLNGSDLLMKKLPLLSVDVTVPWKRCATHVCISYLIQNHQSSERKRPLPIPPNQVKSLEGSKLRIPAGSETAGLRNGLNYTGSARTSVPLRERNALDATAQMLYNGRFLPAEQSSTFSEVYASQKQLPVPFLHPQAQRHSAVPFPFLHVPYASPNAEKLTVTSARQLQLPHYIGNAYYAPHMGHGGSAIKPQQQRQQPIWPTHLTHYRPQMGIPMWQNGRLPDSSPLHLCAQAPSAMSPSSVIEVPSETYQPPNLHQHQLLADHPSPSSSRATHHQHHHHPNSLYDNGGFHPEGPSQLQLLCNAQRS